MLSGDPTRDDDTARSRVLRRLDLQLARASTWAALEVDLLATSLRVVIELLSWARFISQGPEQVQLFLHDAKIDVRELFEKIESLAGDKETFTLLERADGKRIRTEPATKVEDALLKLCHKLIHPSAWLLGEMDTILNDESLRKSFSTNLLFFSWATVQTFHDINVIE